MFMLFGSALQLAQEVFGGLFSMRYGFILSVDVRFCICKKAALFIGAAFLFVIG